MCKLWQNILTGISPLKVANIYAAIQSEEGAVWVVDAQALAASGRGDVVDHQYIISLVRHVSPGAGF